MRPLLLLIACGMPGRCWINTQLPSHLEKLHRLLMSYMLLVDGSGIAPQGLGAVLACCPEETYYRMRDVPDEQVQHLGRETPTWQQAPPFPLCGRNKKKVTGLVRCRRKQCCYSEKENPFALKQEALSQLFFSLTDDCGKPKGKEGWVGGMLYQQGLLLSICSSFFVLFLMVLLFLPLLRCTRLFRMFCLLPGRLVTASIWITAVGIIRFRRDFTFVFPFLLLFLSEGVRQSKPRAIGNASVYSLIKLGTACYSKSFVWVDWTETETAACNIASCMVQYGVP